MISRFVVVIGGAESGVGAALLAKKNKEKVFVSDFGKINEKFKQELLNNKIDFEESGHDFEKIEQADLVIKSPGVPENAPLIKRLRTLGIPIISEIEFGFKYYSGKIIGITGSNGKTTTTGLIHHLFEEAGLESFIGGNYGISFCRQLLNNDTKYAVLELSSFQLDDVDRFKPYVGVLLNISPDHLDRYDYKFENYIDAKFNLIKNQTNDEILIYNKDDKEINRRIQQRQDEPKLIGVERQDYINGIRSKDGIFELTLKGEHNLFNAFCAIMVARNVGISDDEIQKGLLSFKNEPHRLETVGFVNDVEFINDSKATNVDATYYALKAMDKNVIWIAGGTDKGNDYSALFPIVEEKVKALICLGVNNDKLISTFSGKVDIIHSTKDVKESVRIALELAYPGEVVLLTPACASFDLFKNYIDRGNQFKHAVNNYNST